MSNTAESKSRAAQDQQAGEWAPAEAKLRQTLAAQPDNADAHNALGIALFGQGKITDAEHSFRRAIYFQHDFTEAVYNLAKTCYAQESWHEAARLLERSLKLAEPDVLVLDALARLYHDRLGQPDQALHYYRQCLALDPENVEVRFRLEALSGTSTLARMPAEVVSLAWDGEAEQWDRTVHEQGYQSPQWLKAALEPGPALHHGFDVLDLGCGTGLCGACFRAWARSLIGIDLSPKMLAQARARGIYDELIHGDILTATTKFVARFDLVVASDVLLLLGDLATLFQAVHQAARPGGRFAFTVDLHDGPEDYRLTAWSVFGHSRPYLRKLATDLGWQIVAMQEVVFPRNNRGQAAGLVVVLGKPAS